MHLLLTSWVHYAPALPEMQSHTAAGRWVMPGKVPSTRKARTMGGLKGLAKVQRKLLPCHRADGVAPCSVRRPTTSIDSRLAPMPTSAATQ